MWIALALLSALCLGFYDVMKKLSVTRNDVLIVLMLNTLFGFLLMSPVIVSGFTRGYWGLGGTPDGHILILVKALIVLGSWILGYFAIKTADMRDGIAVVKRHDDLCLRPTPRQLQWQPEFFLPFFCQTNILKTIKTVRRTYPH